MKETKCLGREWIEELDGRHTHFWLSISGDAARIGCVMEFWRSFFKKEGVSKMISKAVINICETRISYTFEDEFIVYE